ncbi:MAG: PadR family transcriptional regulator [Gemmatimonadota bacterium]|jgi:DNA-binding PadR family transcriptional regulator
MRKFLGEFEHMVLAATLRLGSDAYGAALIREIRGETGRRVPSGSLSLTLDRLEDKGLVRSRMGDPDPVRGGRPRRYVEVTASGVRAVRETREAMLSLWRGLESKLERR